MQTVTILGAGKVGRTLGERLAQAGATVRFGVRDSGAKGELLTGALAGAKALAIPEAAAAAEVILLTVPAAAAEDALRAAGDLTGKIVVDCTNPVRWDGGPVPAPPAAGSVTQSLAASFPGVRFLKGFNHFGVEIMARPALPAGPADALFAGDDADAKSVVMKLAAGMGFRPQDAGPLRNAPLLEHLAVLWIHLGTVGGVGREFAFRIERRS